MKLNQLEYFCAVCRCHSITRAAETLYVTQPTISVAIRELEKELHLHLFRHEKNRIYLTPEGEAFYRRAEALVRESREMVADFSAMGNRQPPLRVGIPPMMSTLFFPALSDRFIEATGQPVQLMEYGSVKARDLVQSEELDIALVNMDFYNLDQFDSLVLMEDSYTYCVSRTHRFAGLPEITFDMLGGEKIILFNTDSVQNDTIFSRYRSQGLTPDVLLYSSQLYTILNFVRSGCCGAFLFSSLAVNPRDFVQLPVKPEIPCRFGLIWKKGVLTPARTTAFLDYVRTVSAGPPGTAALS